MDSIKALLKQSGMTNIIVSIIFGIFGVILCIFHETAMKLISILIGVLFLGAGLARIVNYIQGRGRDEHLNGDLLLGVILFIFGIVAIVYTNTIGMILRTIVAIWIIYAGISKTYLSMKLKELGASAWIVSLVLSIIIIIFGLFILFYNGAIITLIGAIMIAYAIIDIIENVIFIRRLN